MADTPRRAVLVTFHYAGSRRRAGFHFIGDALRRAGWHVTFVTVGFSQLSRLRHEHRFEYRAEREAGRVITLAPDLDSYVWFTPFHPVSRLPGPIELAATPLFARYGSLPMPNAEAFVRGADLFIFESMSALILVERFRVLSPDARFVYRVSDDLEFLRAHPVVRAAQAKTLPTFDLVSVPSMAIFRKLEGTNSNVRLQHHGIEKALFDTPGPSPYGDTGPNAVFVGTSHLDRDFLERAAAAFPSWQFHVVGALGSLPTAPNLHAWGELPFVETIPFITYADIGLAIRSSIENAEALSDSLKVIQYTYARLPIVAPEVLGRTRPNVISYRPGDDASIRAALEAAASFNRATISREGILSWDELAGALAGSTVI